MENTNATNHPNSGNPYRNHERAERITIIHRLVYDATYNGKKVTSDDLEKACGVDKRTIYEDRLYMSRHDMPMKFCRKAQSYKFTKAVDYNPKMLMSEG